MNFVVDASIVLKWLVEEDDSAQVAQLMRLPLLAPDLLVSECMNALWKKVERQELLPDEALAAADVLRRAPINLEPTGPLGSRALALAMRLAHPVYDCMYLALAVESGAIFVTADQRFLSRCLRPDATDLAAHVRSLHQVGREVQEQRARYAPRRRMVG